MVILCPVKRVPDPYQRVRLGRDGEVETGTIKWVASPVDEAALIEACRLRALRGAGEVVAVTVGPPESEDVLRAALARGADRALLIVHANPSNAVAVAPLLARAFQEVNAEVVLMGRQAPDTGDGQTGPRLAALLELPQITGATAIQWDDNGESAQVTRDGAHGAEVWEVTLPAVITCDLRLNALPPLPLMAIVGARRKPLERVEAGTWGLEEAEENALRVVSLTPPPARTPVQILSSADELAAVLRERAGLPFRAGGA